MRRFVSIFVVCVLFSALFAGCGRKKTASQKPGMGKVVAQIDVTCKKDESALFWQYTDQEKMEAILLYLRLLHRGGGAQIDPNRVKGDHYEIVLHYSDGRKRVYYQHADRYLSDNYAPWEKIDPEQGKDLMLLLRSMPSDGL